MAKTEEKKRRTWVVAIVIAIFCIVLTIIACIDGGLMSMLFLIYLGISLISIPLTQYKTFFIIYLLLFVGWLIFAGVYKKKLKVANNEEDLATFKTVRIITNIAFISLGVIAFVIAFHLIGPIRISFM